MFYRRAEMDESGKYFLCDLAEKTAVAQVRVGPPGYAVSSSLGPHIQAHQPLFERPNAQVRTLARLDETHLDWSRPANPCPSRHPGD